MKKLFVWDFHGTLEKGNELAALEISNRVLENFGYDVRFSEQEGKDLYGKKWYEYFEYLLPDEAHETHIKLQEASFSFPEAAKIIKLHLLPNDYAIEVLDAVSCGGHDQIVISNTVPEALPIFVEAAGLAEYFKEHNTFAVMAHMREVRRSKSDVLNEYLLLRPKYDQIISIGDSMKDMELVEADRGRGYLLRRPGKKLDVHELKPHIRVINSLDDILHEARSEHI